MTDPNDITAARERLRQAILNIPLGCESFSNTQLEAGYKIGHRDALDAAAELMLAAEPDDNETFLAEDWLRRVGFALDHELTPPRNPMFHVGGLMWRPHYFAENQGLWQFGPMSLPEGPKTRGDVRLLMKALGIKSKEPAHAE